MAQTAQSLATQNPRRVGEPVPRPPPSAVLDDVCGAVEKVVANQREFGHQLVATVKPVVEAAAAAVPTVGAAAAADEPAAPEKK